MSEPKRLDENDLRSVMGGAFARTLAFQQSPEGRAAAADEERKRERARLNKLHALADVCGAPAQRDVRAAAFALHPVGGLIDAVRDLFTFARPPKAQRGGRTPALRVLLSPPGVGKSVALTFAVAHAPRGAVYVSASELSRTHRAMHDNRAAWLRWVNVDLLCIDELGVEEKPEVVAELMLDRWTQGGMTLCAGNLTRKTFTTRYLGGALGERLEDRVREQAAQGLLVLVESSETSRRAKKAAAR